VNRRKGIGEDTSCMDVYGLLRENANYIIIIRISNIKSLTDAQSRKGGLC